MLLNRLARTLLISSAIAPMLFCYGAVEAFRTRQAAEAGVPVLVGVLLVACCLGVLTISRRTVQPESVTVQSIRTTDGEIVGFALTYLLPLANASSVMLDPALLLVILVVLFALIGGTYSYHVNPVLALFGYHFFEIQTSNNISYVLVSRRTLKRASAVKHVIPLTEYMVLDPEDA